MFLIMASMAVELVNSTSIINTQINDTTNIIAKNSENIEVISSTPTSTPINIPTSTQISTPINIPTSTQISTPTSTNIPNENLTFVQKVKNMFQSAINHPKVVSFTSTIKNNVTATILGIILMIILWCISVKLLIFSLIACLVYYLAQTHIMNGYNFIKKAFYVEALKTNNTETMNQLPTIAETRQQLQLSDIQNKDTNSGKILLNIF